MKCGTCKGRKALHAGNGVTVPCPGCGGAGKVTATLAEREAAKRAAVDQETRAARSPTVLKFVVPGEPVPKGRPRSALMGADSGKPFIRHYTPGATEAYEAKVKTIAQLAVNAARWAWSKHDRFSVIMRIVRTHLDKGGDIDNYEKAIMDAMNGVVYRTDGHVRGKGTSILEPDRVHQRIEVEVRRFRCPR